MATLASIFASSWFKPALYGVLAGIVVIAGVTIFNKIEDAGAQRAVNAVQTDTIKQMDNARKQKQRIDEEIRTTPYTDRVDRL